MSCSNVLPPPYKSIIDTVIGYLSHFNNYWEKNISLKPHLINNLPFYEAYSAAGKTWFGWWLVEHYFSYHIDCPDGCDSGEPARGRKDPPYFQMSYGSLDNIPDLVDPLVESPLPVQ